MYKHKISIVVCARWEELDIVEWVEFHRSIGVDHIYLYSNDDECDVLYKRLQPYVLGKDPYITYLYWSVAGEQLPMYFHFLEHFGEESEWVSFLDVDEFIVIRKWNWNIKEFINDISSICDCVYLNWLNFGNNGKIKRDEDSILLTRTRRTSSLNIHTKTIFRTSKVTYERAISGYKETGLSPTHFWDRYPFEDFRIISPTMRRLVDYGVNFPINAQEYFRDPYYSSMVLETAYIAHFQFKSEADFLRRVERGGFKNQEMWKGVYESGDFRKTLNHLNEVEDYTLRDYWQDYIAESRKYIPADVRP